MLNVKSRLFTEDVPYGLCILKDIADKVNVEVPNVVKIGEWHQKFMDIKYFVDGKLNPETLHLTGAPSQYGIKTIEELVKISASL